MNFIQNTTIILVVTSCLSLCTHAQKSNSDKPSFEEFKSQQTRKLCVNYLDGYLCLSREQKDAMEKLLEEHWTESFDSSTSGLFWVGYNSIQECMASLDSKSIQSILSDGQLSQLELLPTHALNQSAQLKYLREPEDAKADPLKITLDVAKNLEIQRLKSLLKLNEKQTKLLRVAAKGATASILAQRKSWKTKLVAGANGLDWVPIAVEAPAARIRNNQVWQKTLKRILSAKQIAVLNEDRNEAFMESAKASSHTLALSYFRKTTLSEQEYEGFTKLLNDAINTTRAEGKIVRENSLAFEAVDIFIRLEDVEIKKAISKANWEELSPILSQVRSINDAQENADK